MIGLIGMLAGPIIEKVIGPLINLIPNEQEREKARLDATQKLLETVSQLDLKQVEVNIEEAKHSSIFVAGWRPWIGWVCGAAVFYSFIVHPIVTGFGYTLPMPMIDHLYELVLAMLGMAGLRSFEKIKGVERKRMDQ